MLHLVTVRQDPRCASCYGPSLAGISQEVLSTEFSPTIEVGRKRKPIQDQFLQCPRRDNQPRHMNSDLKCTFSTPSSRSGTVQPPHVRTRSWARIHRITQEAARLHIRRAPAIVDHPSLESHYGSLLAMTSYSVHISHFPYWELYVRCCLCFHEHAQWCANTGPSQEPYLTHRGTSDAAPPKILAQDHESLNQRSLLARQPKEVMICKNSTSATVLPRRQLFLRQQLPPKFNFAYSVDHNVKLDRICTGSGSSHTQRC